MNTRFPEVSYEARLPKNSIDFTSSEFIQNPYSAYARLRNETPVCWDEKLSYWVVSRYEDVHPLLRDKRWSSNQLGELMSRLTPEQQAESGPLREILTNRMVLCDNPTHHRIRGLMSLAFTPRRVELMRPIIQAIADELLDRIASGGRADLIAA